MGSSDHLVVESAYEKCSLLNRDYSFAMLLQSIQHGGEKEKSYVKISQVNSANSAVYKNSILNRRKMLND